MATPVALLLLLSLAWPPPSAPAPTGAFSAALVLDGGRIYVGEPGETVLFPMPPNRPGAVHVYAPDSAGGWVREETVSPADVGLGDRFGEALAVRDGVMVVGAPGAGGDRGVVRVFVRRGGRWREAARLEAPGGAPGDRFGAALALSDQWLLVGAPGAREGAGSVTAFRRDGDRWTPAGSVAGPTPGGRFGAALSLRDARAAVGAPGPMPPAFPAGRPPLPLPGSVHVLGLRAGGWGIVASVAAGGVGPGMLGAAVLLTDGALYAGAPMAGGSGRVVRYREGDAGWTAVDTLAVPGVGPIGLGMALAAAGPDILVGAPLQAPGGGQNLLYAFRSDGSGGWTRVEVPGPEGRRLAFGLAIAAADGVAVVAAPGADAFEGTGHVYLRGDDGTWGTDRELIAEPVPVPPITGWPRPCRDGRAEGRGCSGVDLLAFLPVDALGGGRGSIVNDLWGWTDPETGREYGLVGRSDALVFVDVSEPWAPRVVGELPRTAGSPPSLWRDVKVYADHAFVVSDAAGDHGVQVFDLRRLRSARPGEVFLPDTVYHGIASAHNIAIDEESGLAAVVGAGGGGRTCGGGLHMIDVRDPLRPAFAGCFADPATGMGYGYTHDAQCVTYRGPDARYRGHEICLGSNVTALSIADVTDPQRPVPVAVATYPNTGYLHQGWLSEDQRYFFTDDETDEVSGLVERTRTLVWDLSALDDPVLVAEHLGTTRASDHNLYVRGDTMYQANYVSGLRILDVSDPESPREVGYFDTVPAGDDAPGFAGAWSVYPFFSSGTLLVTSIREGLFVLRARPEPVS